MKLNTSTLACDPFPASSKACRYPRGEKPDYDFCGAPVQAGSPYCPEHHERCCVPPPKTKRHDAARAAPGQARPAGGGSPTFTFGRADPGHGQRPRNPSGSDRIFGAL